MALLERLSEWKYRFLESLFDRLACRVCVFEVFMGLTPEW